MPKIMTDEAIAIADKLKRDAPKKPKREKFNIETSKGGKHNLVKIYYKNKFVGQYGIQRSSKPKNHNYVAGQIHLSLNDAYDLAKCPLDVDAYIDILERKGEIQVDFC